MMIFSVWQRQVLTTEGLFRQLKKIRLVRSFIVNKEVELNEVGRIVVDEWSKSAQIRAEIELDA